MSNEPVLPVASTTSPQVWLGRYAAWGMPVAYVLMMALAFLGLKPPALIVKVFVGGGAIRLLQQALKKEPANEYALAARKVVRIQMGAMLAAELLTIPLIFVLSKDSVLMAGGVIIFAALAVHIVIAILGAHRLGAIVDRYI